MTQLHCWCNNSNLIPFNEDYFRCLSCRTLVCRSQPESPAAFYGREYWTTRQTNTLGHPDIYNRARLDISERAIYWLKTVLKYKRPPGKTLELGSGHGGFSALLNWAGFEAAGLEPHAWVSQLAQTIFNIPTFTGRLADQTLEPQSLDAIILLDVLEHLPDPVETLHLCYALLKPDGLLLIQTPCAPQSETIEELEAAESPFLKMLLPLEHLYLYSQQGIQQLLNQTGFEHAVFENALFPYDMFLVAAVSGLPIPDESDPAESLLKMPASRLVLALLDLHRKWETAEMERQAQFDQVEELTGLLKESEADRLARQVQIDLTGRQLLAVEQDRQARLEQNEKLAMWLETAEKERTALQQQVTELTGWLETAEHDRAARLAQVNELNERLAEAETDRQARLEQVNEMTKLLEESEADRAARMQQINELTRLLEESAADRQARLEQIKELTTLLEESNSDRAARLEQINELTSLLAESDADRAVRLEQVNELSSLLAESEADRQARLEQVNELTDLLAESEADRAARFEQIQTLIAALNNLQSQPDDPESSKAP